MTVDPSPSVRVRGYFAPGTGPNAARTVARAWVEAESNANGLVRTGSGPRPRRAGGLAPPITSQGRKAPHVDPIADLPEGVRCIRRARLEDAEAIARIQDEYGLVKIDASDDPKRGWLVQKATPEWIRATMGHTKDFWVAEAFDGRIIAFQTVTAPRHISRPAAKHVFFEPYQKRALSILQSGKFIYMSQIAASRDFRSKGVAAALQEEVLKRYPKYPLLAHVAVFTQDDFDRWDGNQETFAPHTNNVASHRYHQKHGYVPIAWTSDLARTDKYNSGIEPPNDGESMAVCGVLYLHFRDGEPPNGRPYVDPLRLVLDTPFVAEAQADESSFPAYEPSPDFEDEGRRNGLGSDYADIARHLHEMLRGKELVRIRRGE
jgi:hypothetical protein